MKVLGLMVAMYHLVSPGVLFCGPYCFWFMSVILFMEFKALCDCLPMTVSFEGMLKMVLKSPLKM